MGQFHVQLSEGALQEWVFNVQPSNMSLPSGYAKIAIENDHL
jgi:hypothetical protein